MSFKNLPSWCVTKPKLIHKYAKYKHQTEKLKVLKPSETVKNPIPLLRCLTLPNITGQVE